MSDFEAGAAAVSTEDPKESVSHSEHPSSTTASAEKAASEGKYDQIQPSDFLFGTTLGEGAFAMVVHAKSKSSSTEFAIKIMEKTHIKKEEKVKYVLMERRILTMVNHPLIVKFHFSFQDCSYLYMCMDLAKGGELRSLINKRLDENIENGVIGQACDVATTKFYIAEIVEALRYLHGIGIIHRDLKPENILLDENGHIKVTDFGTSMIIGESDETDRTSFVGTQDYVSPEVLSGEKESSKSSDLWAVGCMIFQFLTGVSPFHADTEYLTFHAITSHCDGSCPLVYPESMNEQAVSLSKALLAADETKRLGAGDDDSDNGYGALKSHIFFEGVNWESLCTSEPPYKPDSSKFPSAENMRDGVIDDWLFDGELSPVSGSYSDPTKAAEKPKKMHRHISQVIDTAHRWGQFLEEDEKQIFTSTIYKRKGLFSKRRQLILTDRPRLVYVDPETMEVKGEIPWTIENPVVCWKKNEKEFEIQCTVSGRTYHLSDADAGAQNWVDLINAMLIQQTETMGDV